jgi:hypothetical protein
MPLIIIQIRLDESAFVCYDSQRKHLEFNETMTYSQDSKIGDVTPERVLSSNLGVTLQ